MRLAIGGRGFFLFMSMVNARTDVSLCAAPGPNIPPWMHSQPLFWHLSRLVVGSGRTLGFAVDRHLYSSVL